MKSNMAGFRKAKREQIYAKVLCAGPSGSGKTYSSLRLAIGIARRAGGRVAAIDTENRRIRYYASEFDFDDMQLSEPYSPESYIKAINEAVDAGYTVLVIDSISHEWDYCNDLNSKMPAGSNTWANWKTITPRHDAFMEKILQSPIHVVATVRGKDEYVLEDKDGKKVPKKIGLGYKQRNDTEYNYTVVFNIDQKSHVADAVKDNTHLFENRYEVLTEKDGEAIYDWANAGETPDVVEPQDTGKVAELIQGITSVVSDWDDAKKKKAAGAFKKILVTTADYKTITDVNKLQQCLEAIKSL